MRIMDTIVKHAGIILVIWIIIALISAPATTNLNKITEFNAQRMLPNGTEAVQANNLLAKIRGSTANGMAAIAYDVILVSGINTNDTGLLSWDHVFIERVKPYVKDYVSPYRVANEAIADVIPKINNTAERIFEGVNESYIMLSQLYSHRYEIIHGIDMLSRQLHMLRETADQLYDNRTMIRERTKQLLANLTMLKQAYNKSCIGYKASIEGLEKLLAYYPEIRKALVMGDTLYHELYVEETRIYASMLMLNKTITGLNKLFYNMSTTYDVAVFNTIRIYYLLRYHTDAFTRGLSQADIMIVLNLTKDVSPKISPSMIAGIYYTVVKMYKNPENLTLQDLYSLTSRMLLKEAPSSLDPKDKVAVELFIDNYSLSLYNYTYSELIRENITNLASLYATEPVKAQLLTMKTIMDAHKYALPVSVTVFAKEYSNYLVRLGIISGREKPLIEAAAITAYKLGENPEQNEISEAVINTVEPAITNQTNGELPKEAVKAYLESLYNDGPVREPALKALTITFSNIDMPTNMTKLVLKTILSYDPRAEGIIEYNPYIAYRASVEILAKISGLPSEIIEQTITLGQDYIPVIAGALLEEKLAEKTGDKVLATIIANIIMENKGKTSLQGFMELVNRLFENMRNNAILEMIPKPLIKYIITGTWYGNITDMEAWKLLLGTPIAYIAYKEGSITDPVRLVEIINKSAIVNSIINNTYPKHPDEYVASDALMLEKILGATSNSEIPIIKKIDQRRLILLVLKYPENLTSRDIALILYEIYSNTLPTTSTNGFNKTIIKDMIIRIIGDAEPPKQVIIEETLSLLPSNISRTSIEPAIIEAIDEKNPKPIYSALMAQINQTILEKVLEAFNKTLISPDGRSFIILIDPRGTELDQLYSNAMKAKDIANETLWAMGYIPSYIGVTGDHVLVKEMKNASEKDIATVNRVSMIAPFIIALIIIGGVIAAGLPFIGIGMAILLSLAIIYLLGSLGVITVTSWSRMLMITTAFGLGMDYSSYIVLRFKEEIAMRDRREAAKIAIKQTLPAIMAAASTDIIGFAVMLLAWDFPLLSSIGQTIPFAVLAVLLVSLTLTPALLALFGDKKWFWWPHRAEKGGAHWAGFKINKRRAAGLILVSLIIMAGGAYGLVTFNGSHDYSVFLPAGMPGYETYIKLENIMPMGELLPVYVVGVAKDSVFSNKTLNALRDLASVISRIPGVEAVYGPQNPGGRPKTYYVASDNRTFMLEVIMKPSPESREGIELTKKIIDAVHSYHNPVFEKLLIGGLSVIDVEIEKMLNQDFWHKIFPVGIALMWLAMSLSFASIWAGIIAMITIAAGYMIGVTTASLIPGLYGIPALWFLPLMLFPAVLGVGMDYNSFYMNRFREELDNTRGKDSYGAAYRSIRAVSHLVIGLGSIVTATYASLILGSSWGIKEIGIALSVGVLTITIMSALALTPALLALLGRAAWWPYSRRWKSSEINTDK